MLIRCQVAIVFMMSILILPTGCSSPRAILPLVITEQRTLDIREPKEIPNSPLPQTPPPATVFNPAPTGAPMELSLDEALRIALANAKVVRTLAGTSVVSTGQTIYDPAIANTAIDAAKSAFDPVIEARNAFSNDESPQGIFDPANPFGSRITGNRINNYELGLGVAKKLVTGGTVRLDGTLTTSRVVPGPAPLNPQERSALTLSLTQPLLQGAGIAPNVAPIVIARINTERSFFRLKDSVQDLTRGVIEAYWQVVFARTDVWARRQQVEQGEFAYARAEARKKAGFANDADVAQAKLGLSNFRAAVVGADANLLEREAALRNILGLPPTVPERFVPITPPTPEYLDPKWTETVRLAEEMRPDLIELNLILEADQQNLLQANNQALPKVDASMFYRWNGLEGTTPSGAKISSSPGQFTDWSLGVNFSVPLGLRQGRANLRNAELLLIADRANLNQARHNTLHILAGNLRNLAKFYGQYKSFRETRTAARINLEQQAAEFRAGRAIFLNVLQAITNWGDAVSSEAQALAQYNIELANLERQTGTILESHGIRFMEERFQAIGPLGRLANRVPYPLSVVPGPNDNRYPETGGPPEKSLDKDRPKLLDPVPPGEKDQKQAPQLVPPVAPAALLPARFEPREADRRAVRRDDADLRMPE